MSLVSSLSSFVGNLLNHRAEGADIERLLAKEYLGANSFPSDPKQAGGISSRELGIKSSPGRFRYFKGNDGDGTNVKFNRFKLILSDFDGSQYDSERVRQLAWMITARSPKWEKFFGGKDIVDQFAKRYLKEYQESGSDRSLFEDTIGASEQTYENIMKSIGKALCLAAGTKYEEEKFNFKEFKSDRDALVDKVIAHGWLPAMKGLTELYNYARWADIPICIVTQSKRAFVEKVMRKNLGDDFVLPEIVSKEDLEKFSITAKPDTQPYRFAAILMTLKMLEKSGLTSDNPVFLSEDSKRCFAATASSYRIDSQTFRNVISENLGANAHKFMQLLPELESCLVIEDSDKGAKAGREMKVALVRNGVDKISQKLTGKLRTPDQMTQKDTGELDKMIAALGDNDIKIMIAGTDLLGVVDLLRVTNPIPLERLKQIVREERPEIDLAHSYSQIVKLLADQMRISGCEETLMLGAFRSVDRLILQQTTLLEPGARIMDIGCGTTVPFFTNFDGNFKPNQNYSSPTIARLLAMHGFDVVAIDQASDEIQDTREASCGGILISRGDKQSPRIVCASFANFGLNAEDIIKSSVHNHATGGRIITPDSDVFQILQKQDLHAQTSQISQYEIYPYLCSKLEKDLFGLKVFGGIDISKLDKHLDNSSILKDTVAPGFDLIFCRNHPSCKDLNQTFIRDVLAHLKSGGKIVYEISRTLFARDPEAKFPSMLDARELEEFKSSLSSDYKLEVQDLGDADAIVITKV